MSIPRILTAEDIRRALPMPDAVAAMRDAFRAVADGTAVLPPRTSVPLRDAGATLLVMPGGIPHRLGIGVKLVSVVPGNVPRGRPVVQGIVVLFDAQTGEVAALLDGPSLTAIRTGAASGLATDLLALPDASRVAIVGAGVQARTQLEAVCTVRPVRRVKVWSRTRAHAERFVEEMRGRSPVPNAVTVVSSAAEAVADAEIVCTATAATDPVLRAADVPAGAHLNAVGSFTPAMREFEPALLREAAVVVDQRTAALAEAGEIIAARAAGILDERDLVELGELLVGARRPPPARISVFKSVGLAVQDLAAGARALAGASARP